MGTYGIFHHIISVYTIVPCIPSAGNTKQIDLEYNVFLSSEVNIGSKNTFWEDARHQPAFRYLQNQFALTCPSRQTHLDSHPQDWKRKSCPVEKRKSYERSFTEENFGWFGWGGPSSKKVSKIYEPFFCTISDSCLSRREVQLLQLHEIVEIQPEDKQPSC